MEYMFMPLRRYAQFTGRSRRMEFWMFFLFQFLIGILFVFLIFAVGGSALMMSAGDPTAALAAGGAMMIVLLLMWVVQLALLIPNLAVSVRRLHDTGRSGWWVFLPIAPYIVMIVGGGMQSDALVLIASLALLAACIVLLVFYFLDGTHGPNQYGEDPKARGTAGVFA